MNCCYHGFYQCPYMRGRTFNFQGYYCPYYKKSYHRQEDQEFEVEEESPPPMAPGTFAAIDPEFAIKAARRCKRSNRRNRVRVYLESGEVLTLRDFTAGDDSLYGINVANGDDEVIDYKIISRLKCMRRRVRNGNPYDYEYEECDCAER